MTLSVNPYIRNRNGDIEWLEMSPDRNELAGTEATRTKFYGSKKLKSIGLVILPSLAVTDIFAEGKELIDLEKEIDILISELTSVCDPQEIDYWSLRLFNIKEAIVVAKKENGGVCIQ